MIRNACLLLILMMTSSSFAATETPAPAASVYEAKDVPLFQRTCNLNSSPVALAVGEIAAGADCGISTQATLGPVFGYAYRSHGKPFFRANENLRIGLRSMFYLSRPKFEGGWYVAPTLYFTSDNISQTVDGKEYTGGRTSFDLGAPLGYQWVWKSGFNINVGVGPGFSPQHGSYILTNSSGQSKTYNSSDPNFYVSTEANVGLIF